MLYSIILTQFKNVIMLVLKFNFPFQLNHECNVNVKENERGKYWKILK